MGTPKRESTLAKSFAPGRASSRAKAQVHLEAATVMEMEQKSCRGGQATLQESNNLKLTVITNTKNTNASPPPGLPMTMWKMYLRFH